MHIYIPCDTTRMMSVQHDETSPSVMLKDGGWNGNQISLDLTGPRIVWTVGPVTRNPRAERVIRQLIGAEFHITGDAVLTGDTETVLKAVELL